MAFSPFVRFRLTGLIILAMVFAFDQWSKVAILSVAAGSPLHKDLLPVFSLVLVRNTGISFGLFAHGESGAMMLTAATSLVAFLLFLWLMVAREKGTAIALGFILGGALGNILDRLRYGAVTDFLDFHLGAHHWPAFNLADSAIFIGVVILVLISIVGRAEPVGEIKP